MMNIPVSVVSRVFLKIFIVVSTLTSAVVVANAADVRKPVFAKGACLGKISSDMLSSLKKEIHNSQKYRLVRDLSDEGQMDVVLTIDINCAERNSVAAIATVFGRAKCFSLNNCHIAIDGSSIRSDLCDSNAVAECGQALFKALDDYVNNPIRPSLKLY